MGYRSDVQFVFYVKGGNSISGNAFPILKLWFDENYPRASAVDDWGAEIDTDDATYIRVSYYDVKWYDSYAHPQEVAKATDLFSDTFEGASGASAKDQDAHPSIPIFAWESARIGEEPTDLEHDGSTWHDYRLDFVRDIRFV